jgi:hypothetical protein
MATATATPKRTIKKKATVEPEPMKPVASSIATIATVPEMDYYDSYISRKFSGTSEFDIFDYSMWNLRNVLIEGPTGPGKTSAALAYAALRELPFYAIPSNVGIEPSQLFGKYIPHEGGGFIWVDGPVTSIVRNGGILLINEVNFMPDRVATVLFGLLDKRREIVLLDHKGETVRAHRGEECWCGAENCEDKMVLVMADMNPDYEGTRPLNKAFRNRFAVQLHWDYDDKIERKLVTAGSLVDMAQRLRQAQARGEYETPISTNMLQEFEEVYYALGIDFARINFVNHFQPEERASVDQIVKTFDVNITSELDEADDSEDPEVAVNDEDDEDFDDDDVEWAYEDEADDDA